MVTTIKSHSTREKYWIAYKIGKGKQERKCTPRQPNNKDQKGTAKWDIDKLGQRTPSLANSSGAELTLLLTWVKVASRCLARSITSSTKNLYIKTRNVCVCEIQHIFL